jgi:uncharacterized protein (DUF427 family)
MSVRVEPYPRWVRGRLGGKTVVDSRRASLVYEPDRQIPRYAFPESDVRLDALPAEAIKRTDGLVQVDFDALDEWLEEDEPQVGHPSDVFHRIDVRQSSRHVRVSIGGRVVAETRRAKALFETGLPVRWYFPVADLRAPLEPSEHRTTCAYKGHATHFDVAGEDAVAWTYTEPLHDGQPIRGLVAFYNERVDLEVDGELEERPQTQWSRSSAH